MQAWLSSMGMQASAVASQVSAISAVGSMANALMRANDAMDAKKMSKVMVEFTRQNEIAKVKEELLNDALVDAFNESNMEEEADLVSG